MTFDEAHTMVDAWLTEEGRRGRKGEAETDATLRRAIETVLRTALDKVDPIVEPPTALDTFNHHFGNNQPTEAQHAHHHVQ